ncbi:MAG: GTP:adenosylcobinamide-phosphate guanylyltransferase [Candidatus Omnitrophota bacterium]
MILAGGEDEAWCHQYGYKTKPFLPLNGKPMLERVLQAFHASQYIDKIVVVGPKELDQLDCMKYVHRRVSSGRSFIENLLRGIFHVKTFIYKWAFNHNGYLVSFCDAAFLTTDVIDYTINTIDKHKPCLALHYVAKETIMKGKYLGENRTFMYIAGKPYTGANIYYVHKFRFIFRVLKDLMAMRRFRKQPSKMLQHLECEGKPFSYIEVVLSKMMKAKAKIFVSPYAEMGVDIDKPIDYELAKSMLEEDKSDCLAFDEMDLEDVCHKSDETDLEV